MLLELYNNFTSSPDTVREQHIYCTVSYFSYILQLAQARTRTHMHTHAHTPVNWGGVLLSPNQTFLEQQIHPDILHVDLRLNDWTLHIIES